MWPRLLNVAATALMEPAVTVGVGAGSAAGGGGGGGTRSLASLGQWAPLPAVASALSEDDADAASAGAAAYAVEERRRHTVLEIWETELKYVQCLSIAQAVYVIPLRNAASSGAASGGGGGGGGGASGGGLGNSLGPRRPIIPQATVDVLFGNLDEVIALAKEVRAGA